MCVCVCVCVEMTERELWAKLALHESSEVCVGVCVPALLCVFVNVSVRSCECVCLCVRARNI